jgi:type II restriction enzyme
MIVVGDEDDGPHRLNLGFGEKQQAPYRSGSQNARVDTETWVGREAYCANCGHEGLTKFPNNKPLADFYCESCNEQFEVKSQRGAFGGKVADGAYEAKIERLRSDTNPNLLLLNYSHKERSVTNLIIVPKHFFRPEIIQKRRPLAPTARRAGWIGSNILLSEIPGSGKIFIVKDGLTQPREAVLQQWRRTLFLKEQTNEARGWLLEVMNYIEALGRNEFGIDDVYTAEHHLQGLYPHNKHVKEKIRQKLQDLRDLGYLEFVSRGRYRIIR